MDMKRLVFRRAGETGEAVTVQVATTVYLLDERGARMQSASSLAEAPVGEVGDGAIEALAAKAAAAGIAALRTTGNAGTREPGTKATAPRAPVKKKATAKRRR
jgi:hypothetical protein